MEEAEQAAKEERHSSDSFVSEQLSSESDEDDSFLSKSSKDGSKDADREKEEDQDVVRAANGDLADDMLAHKAALRRKRDEFVASLDENLSEKMRGDLIKHFDDQMTLLAANI